jgi:hypothetical protein
MSSKCKLLERVDPKPFLDEIVEEHYGINTLRQVYVTEQKHTESIFLRDTPSLHPNLLMRNTHDNRNTPLHKEYPRIMSYLREFAVDPKRGNGYLSRVIIARLKPRSDIEEHVDVGAYHMVRKRYHVVLKSVNGSEMGIDGEKFLWKEGEVYWFNNNVPHSVRNNSDEWRTHVIFDLLPFDNLEMVRKFREFYYREVGVPEFIIDDFRYT